MGDGLNALKRLNRRLAVLQNLVRDYSHPTMPQWISFTTTTFCNLRCPHCQTHGTDEVRQIYNGKRWPDDLVERLARESLPFADEFCLSLSGEPLATPRLKQRLREFRGYGAKLHLTTNGTLLSPDTLVRVLPLASRIDISMDGATAHTSNAIRLGSRFEQLVHNVKLLTRVRELFPWKEPAPEVRLACTLMASNVRDMPEMVRLASFLGVAAVDFYDLIVFFPHLRGEDLKLHQPLFNAVRERAQQEAQRLGVALQMPAAFPEVRPTPSLKIAGSDLILGRLPDDYYATLPPLDSVVDLNVIEAQAHEVVSRMLAEGPETEQVDTARDLEAAQETARLERALQDLLQRHAPELEPPDGEAVPYCENLFRRTFVGSEGEVSPCCVPGRPELGNVNDSTLAEIYNGERYQAFRRQFFSATPPACCVGCRAFSSRPRQDLLREIDG